MLIQKLRLKHGWSQQQLADASGLSARTIQRIEAGQPASTETLKSLAAVFEVDFSTLDPEKPVATAADTLAERQEQEAFRFVRRLRIFYVHLIQFVVVIPALWAINLIVTPQHLWVIWPSVAWGLVIALHALSVFRPSGFLGPDWERKQVEKRLGRSL